jgi:transcriptional regulator with XRE-family HTH domain
VPSHGKKPQRPPNPPPPPEAKAIGRQIRKLREALEMTQEEVAEAAELDRAYFAGIEVGLRNPSLRPLIRIARALNVPLSKLFTGVR